MFSSLMPWFFHTLLLYQINNICAVILHIFIGIDTKEVEKLKKNFSYSSCNKMTTVKLCSKGPGRKGNPPIREIISGSKNHFPFWAADPKGTMSYRTEGRTSVRPSERAKK